MVCQEPQADGEAVEPEPKVSTLASGGVVFWIWFRIFYSPNFFWKNKPLTGIKIILYLIYLWYIVYSIQHVV